MRARSALLVNIYSMGSVSAGRRQRARAVAGGGRAAVAFRAVGNADRQGSSVLSVGLNTFDLFRTGEEGASRAWVARTALQKTGAARLERWGLWSQRHSLGMRFVALFLLLFGVLSVVVPAAVLSWQANEVLDGAGDRIPGWVMVSALTIACAGMLLYVLTAVVASASLGAASRRVSAFVGWLAVGASGMHPAMIFDDGFYGVLARRWLSRQGLTPAERDTYLQMIGEWECSADDLRRFVSTI